MPNVEVLVASMNQEDISLYERMKLSTDAIIANQCSRNEYREFEVNSRIVKLISSSDRGVGKNRNTALLHASGQILLFADDDMVYRDGYEKIVSEAFRNISDADVIVFQIDNMKPKNGRKIHIEKVKKLNIFNSLKYGAARIAVRKESIQKANIWFSLLFGGGAKYCSGEDTIFLRDCFRKGLKVYAVPETIALVKQETSTWFTGHDKKYFHDRGVLLATIFPKFNRLFAFVFAFRFRHLSEKYTFIDVLRFLFQGINDFTKKDDSYGIN